jgi:hypothetical protein
LRCNPPGSALLWAHFTRGKNRGLQKSGSSGKIRSPNRFPPASAGMQTRLFQAGFCLWVLGFAGLAEIGSARAGLRAHSEPASVSGAEQPGGLSACTEAALYLDDILGSLVFSESEQSKNGAGGMVPLYAARVQDLGPDDVAVFKCGACGHTAELWPSLLIGGLGLQPTDRISNLSDCCSAQHREPAVAINILC